MGAEALTIAAEAPTTTSVEGFVPAAQPSVDDFSRIGVDNSVSYGAVFGGEHDAATGTVDINSVLTVRGPEVPGNVKERDARFFRAVYSGVATNRIETKGGEEAVDTFVADSPATTAIATRVEAGLPIETATGAKFLSAEQPRQISKMRNRFLKSKAGKALTIATGTAAIFGANAAVKPAKAEASLGLFGAPASTNINTADQQLKFNIKNRGECDPIVDGIADATGAAKSALEQEGAVELVSKIDARNSIWKTSSGATADGCESEPTTNTHKDSEAFRFAVSKEVAATISDKHNLKQIKHGKGKGMFLVLNTSLRRLCNFQPLTKVLPRSHKRIANEFHQDLSKGAAELIAAAAVATSEVHDNVAVTCEDGTTVRSQDAITAEASALAALATETGKPGHKVIFTRKDGTSEAQVEASFSTKVNGMIAIAKATAKTSISHDLQITCAPGTPVQPPVVVPGNTAPTVNLTGVLHAKVGEIVTWCAIPNDFNGLGDLKVDAFGNRVQFSEVGHGEFITNNYPGNDPAEECIDEAVGTFAETQTITATDADKANALGTNSEQIQIVDPPLGTPGAFDPTPPPPPPAATLQAAA